MAWDFLKKIVGGKEEGVKTAPAAEKPPVRAAAAEPPGTAAAKDLKAAAAPVREKSPAEKTDDELAEELNRISPQILAQAKDPQMRALVIGIYRKMLVAGVDINDDKEVKKWMKKHPEVLQGGEIVKVETVRRGEPRVGRNDPCPCGSGQKYKKCCGSGK